MPRCLHILLSALYNHGLIKQKRIVVISALPAIEICGEKAIRWQFCGKTLTPLGPVFKYYISSIFEIWDDLNSPGNLA